MEKVIITPSTEALNTIDVVINEEGHTAASCIVERLQQSQDCQFAAYKVDHPKDTYVRLKIQGGPNFNAEEVLKRSINGIISDIDDLISYVRQIKE